MREIEIDRGDRVLRVCDTGDPDGAVVIYFHGTPGSRLDLSFGEDAVAERAVRLVTVDRPDMAAPRPRRSGWRPGRIRWSRPGVG